MIGGKHQFHNISTELYRVYEFPGGDKVRINFPVKLAVSERQGHRILDLQGRAHYIPPGWIHLWWEVKPGQEPFAV